MTEPQKPPQTDLPSSSSSAPTEFKPAGKSSAGFLGQKPHFPNPPDSRNPDPATLREQWRFAIRQYSRWYSQAWGSAILAGLSFFALGWVIKGGNPLPSFKPDDDSNNNDNPSSSVTADTNARR
ncbi:unnamed protein product [Linum trigynum]|uniref:Uncharacterized protein n=1 Tax=Linum trigynum TaxID=586398 RepID=A0AAV2GHV5_9ROSI